MNIVFDTNIFLAATNKSGSFCRSLFYEIIRHPNKYDLYISAAILFELNENANELIKKGFVNKTEFQALAKMIYRKSHLTIIKDRLTVVKADPDDDKILECAAACHADLIITMDQHLLKLKTFRSTGIIHPKTFLYILEK